MLNTKLNILFLTAQPASYLLDAIMHLGNKGHSIEIVHQRISSDAPFDLTPYRVLNMHASPTSPLEKIELYKKLREKKFDIIAVAGWSNKYYLKLINVLPANMKLLMCDTPWRNTFRQKFFKIISRVVLKNFTHAWVPGNKQFEYMKYLGFGKHNILKNLYTANEEIYYSDLETKSFKQKKKLLFSGRLVEYKGVLNLYKAFCELDQELKKEWELLIIGNGPLRNNLSNKTDLIILDFCQPNELSEIMRNSDAFILASDKEAWGVAVHEAACCGLPLLLTEGVNSRECFLKDKVNGFLIKNNSVCEIKKTLTILFKLNQVKLNEMRQESHALSKSISRERFTNELFSAYTSIL